MPVVPVVSIGGQETALFLGRGRRVASAVLDLPGRLPLPAKITIRVMPPIDLRDELGADPDIEAGYRLVTSRMQRTLTRLSNQRTLPIVG